jgi:hypothetical protein
MERTMEYLEQRSLKAWRDRLVALRDKDGEKESGVTVGEHCPAAGDRVMHADANPTAL